MELIKDKIDELADLLYQERKDKAYSMIEDLVNDLTQYISQVENQEIQQSILIALQQAFQAMEEDDTTLLADILLYELLENIE